MQIIQHESDFGLIAGINNLAHEKHLKMQSKISDHQSAALNRSRNGGLASIGPKLFTGVGDMKIDG